MTGAASPPDAWFALPVLTGQHIRLEPLTVEHAPGLLAAAGTGDAAEETFRWLLDPAPADVAEARRQVEAALAARARGTRFPYAQVALPGEAVVGSTSLYEVDPVSRALAIGYTWLGRSSWRTPLNTEAKLLLMTYAFETLGAVRVVWHTDIRNERSQAAIARLGAQREGVLRKHRIRRDGSWRDTVQYSLTDEEWPAARERLAMRLARD